MATTYDPSLTTDKDWVRFTVGDTDTSSTNVQLQDEEIEAVLSRESNKWYAAASIVSILHSKYSLAGKGITEKWVGRLRIKRGIDILASDAIKTLVSDLRKQGAFELSPKPSLFRVIRS